MTDTHHLDAAAEAVPEVLRHEPDSVADALDLHLRLTALSAWVNERKGQVVDWLKAKGEARLAEDGAAPTWRLTDGLVLLTDPKPKPAVDDPERFAAWYQEAGGTVGHRRTASVDPDALLQFHDAVDPAEHATDAEYEHACALAANRLVVHVTVTEDVLLPEDVLDGLLTGTDLGQPGDGPRVTIHTPDDDADPYLVDTVTGERIPGTTVYPAGAHAIQVRPTPKAKARVRGELDSLLGPPTIGD